MRSDPGPTWPDATAGSRLSREEQLAEDRLALTDRVIGLEQQAKELREASLLSPSETAAIEATYAAIQPAPIGRVARVMRLPKRVLRRVTRRVLR